MSEPLPPRPTLHPGSTGALMTDRRLGIGASRMAMSDGGQRVRQ